jgi:hypothetical protein
MIVFLSFSVSLFLPPRPPLCPGEAVCRGRNDGRGDRGRAGSKILHALQSKSRSAHTTLSAVLVAIIGEDKMRQTQPIRHLYPLPPSRHPPSFCFPSSTSSSSSFPIRRLCACWGSSKHDQRGQLEGVPGREGSPQQPAHSGRCSPTLHRTALHCAVLDINMSAFTQSF